jgi:ornithine racemase
MATLTIDTGKICSNIIKLQDYLSKNDIAWTLVTKMLCGDRSVLQKIIPEACIKNLHSVGDSRITNLRIIKEIKPDIITMYIKPPALNQVKNVVQYADISLNTSYKTIEALNREAAKQGKVHRIIVMIEMGELREGVLREDILKFYEKVFNLDNIEINGLGTNLGCMYGIEPTYDKLIQLSLYKSLVEAKFDHELELVSGGSSITLPLISKQKVPKGVNHFRIGEAALLGKSPLNNNKFRNLSTSTINFAGEILEFYKKEVVPDGKIGDAAIGQIAELENQHDQYKESYKCIVDFGQLDVDASNLVPKDKRVKFVGTTSDMTVYDINKNGGGYHVHEQLHFYPDYMSVARIMNSRYMTKKVL